MNSLLWRSVRWPRATIRSPDWKRKTVRPAGRICQQAPRECFGGGGLKLQSGYAFSPFQAAAFPRLFLIDAAVSS